MSTHKATYKELNTFVEQRQRIRFDAEAIRLTLEIKKKELEEAYKEAAADKERTKEIEEWASLNIEGRQQLIRI